MNLDVIKGKEKEMRGESEEEEEEPEFASAQSSRSSSRGGQSRAANFSQRRDEKRGSAKGGKQISRP